MQMPSVENGWCFYNIKDNHNLKVGSQGFECSIASEQKNAKSALLFGDSFAGHNSPFWDQIGKKLNLNIQAITTNCDIQVLIKSLQGTNNLQRINSAY